jgi:low temperature requirement protein LtrA
MGDDSGQRDRIARGEGWARLRRSLWQPPRPHGEQPRERVVGPLELFYDLAVVVLVAQAAHHLAGHLTWPGLGEFAAVFTLVWIAWANGSLHHELHGHEDARARSTFLLQILVLTAMAAFIPEAGGARGAAFAVAAGVLFGVLAVLWLLAARGDRPQYRRTSGLFVAGTAACAVLLAATALLPAHARVLASLTSHAHDGRTPAATAWVLCAGAAAVLGATMLVAASLQDWDRDRGIYRPLSRTCAVVAVACVGIGAARPAPLLLGLALVVLLSIPWALAVARRLANPADTPAG